MALWWVEVTRPGAAGNFITGTISSPTAEEGARMMRFEAASIGSHGTTVHIWPTDGAKQERPDGEAIYVLDADEQ